MTEEKNVKPLNIDFKRFSGEWQNKLKAERAIEQNV